MHKLDVIPYSGSNGLYSAIIPSTKDKRFFKAVSETLGQECDEAILHCTLMYSPEKAPSNVAANDGHFNATVIGLDRFGENKQYVVVTLHSDELQAEHARLAAAGSEHTFKPYEPHVTLFEIPENEALDEDHMALVASMIKGKRVSFGEQIIGDMSV